METKQEESGQVEKFTRIFIKIRDVRAAAKAEFDKEDKRLKEQQDKIKGTLLDYCKEQGVESVKTGSWYVLPQCQNPLLD